ncbi:MULTISPECIES: hypothetical protein [unclassified Nocardia]|uniref:hypothetical protein n=1 Tax=unclassified Nocardia TaxID=2637762 RepID=UPI001CE45C16|nr:MULTISPECIES: hypothetical protein [unclassified Nocardia]
MTKIVMELHCPEAHASAAEAERWNAARLVSGLTRLLSGRRCPTCPAQALETGMTVIGGRERETGYCACCQATWLPGQRTRLLAAGRLIGVEPVARHGVRS